MLTLKHFQNKDFFEDDQHFVFSDANWFEPGDLYNILSNSMGGSFGETYADALRDHIENIESNIEIINTFIDDLKEYLAEIRNGKEPITVDNIDDHEV